MPSKTVSTSLPEWQWEPAVWNFVLPSANAVAAAAIVLVDEAILLSVLDPAQSRFCVSGFPMPSVAKEPSVEVEESSGGSLSLKPPKGQLQHTRQFVSYLGTSEYSSTA
ncbi:uncharacterized protein ACHE_40300S [Aspergillus chevalieri]|uniref:Uncharacterized protein n=1 Tax=Aspergillus chevalieri TaxID=182096 RepID=A0A7R7VN42_ASPCH|nr:uncharacterized protein ACHE_40300S [Aspergillus chevalieri]BCR87736.1 hypothetical protein ACHE_40300S [Aspergillus chevalieri]